MFSCAAACPRQRHDERTLHVYGQWNAEPTSPTRIQQSPLLNNRFNGRAQTVGVDKVERREISIEPEFQGLLDPFEGVTDVEMIESYMRCLPPSLITVFQSKMSEDEQRQCMIVSTLIIKLFGHE